jgi:hypothetical protein
MTQRFVAALACAFGCLASCASLDAASSSSTAFVLPGQDLAQGLFGLNEMDMHLHAGLERPVSLQEWVDLAVADGRKVLVVLDHRELYDRTPEEFDAWIAENKFTRWYPTGKEGQKSLMNDLEGLKKRTDVVAFRGWEIWEGELDEGLDQEAMRMAEVIGWHISPNGNPCGKMLIKRIRQIIEVQKEVPVPMIVFHPFSMRIERVQRMAKQQGKDLAALTVQDYRFFQPGEQEEVSGLLRGKSIYIEISRGQEGCWKDPVIREALIADIKPLAEAGVQFTVSTDAHGVREMKTHFDPATYCTEIGVTPQNTNTIVRELLAIRAKGSL